MEKIFYSASVLLRRTAYRNEFIMMYSSGSSVVIEMFFKAIAQFNPDIIILSGVHLLQNQVTAFRFFHCGMEVKRSWNIVCIQFTFECYPCAILDVAEKTAMKQILYLSVCLITLPKNDFFPVVLSPCRIAIISVIYFSVMFLQLT